ncbi:hypothetical protein [Paucibacter sp. M5-1]|uniref:hypothetical protein n=1 Tax=Paucibacter sp. M5-1 TaxID=3015998 RepID=UPI0022B87F21|nr:hypothetical protein [Paucibacter sp. M5-1]MCZ7880127.1 hypothetical protein [Paucibacter sp. M5-1]
MKTHSTIEERVEYGIEAIPEDQMVTVSLRDLKYVHALLGEFVSFFHQSAHTETLDQVRSFVGNKDAGALHVLWEAYYQRMSRMVAPLALQHDDGRFDHPLPPDFYEGRS